MKREGLSLPHHIPIILNVVRQHIRFNRLKACSPQILVCLFLTPHRAEPFAALRQRSESPARGCYAAYDQTLLELLASEFSDSLRDAYVRKNPSNTGATTAGTIS